MAGADFLKLEELILLAIAGKPEIYGLEISSDIERASEGAVLINYGSLYPYLNRLEKKGYITSRWEEENDRKGARRKYYRITDTGLASLDSAAEIRQRLRQPTTETGTNPTNLTIINLPSLRVRETIQNHISGMSSGITIPTQNELDKLVKNLEYTQQEIRIDAIRQLQSLARSEPQHRWTITKALAAFIRAKSPTGNFRPMSDDIKAALDAILQRDRQLDPETERLDLSKAGLCNANLGLANLSLANLSGANLSGANLSGADLREADLREANLSRADLSGANLREASLFNVHYLNIEQLHSAKNWGLAINIPDYLKRK